MSNFQDPDYFRLRDYAEGFTNESPVDLSGREGAPRCRNCGAGIDEDEGCLDADCIAERNAEGYEQEA